MTKLQQLLCAGAATAALAVGALPAQAQAQTAADMTFFITSVGSGKGGDLGGLGGADAHCGQLARAAGSPASRTWRAYLSTQGQGAANAKDRIGAGPWKNAKGLVVAQSVADLHSDNNKLTKENSLDEKGGVVKGRGDQPNEHDILTGSQADGTAFPAGDDRTCNNWTSSGAGAAMVGHHDRQGLNDQPPAKSWNSSHPSRGEGGGCSLPALKGTGGAGLFYCFATN